MEFVNNPLRIEINEYLIASAFLNVMHFSFSTVLLWCASLRVKV